MLRSVASVACINMVAQWCSWSIVVCPGGDYRSEAPGPQIAHSSEISEDVGDHAGSIPTRFGPSRMWNGYANH